MARLPQGVIKRADGLLQKRFTVNGKRYSIYGHTLDELRLKEQEKRLEIAAGQYTKNKNVILDKYFDEFIKSHSKHTKGNTLYNYKCIYNKHISPSLGKCKIASIEKRQCKELQEMLYATETIGITNRSMLILKIVLNAALSDDVIKRNPMQGIKQIKDQEKIKATKTIHKALTEQEQEILLEQLRKDNAFYYECICLLLVTGMRVGEVVALTWKDIDNEKNVIHVNKTLSKSIDGHKEITTPKTATSIRDIPMNATIKAILQQQKKKFLLLWQANGDKMQNRIFADPYGRIPTSQPISNEINKAIKHLCMQGIEIDRLTCHGLRDTFATRFIEQGGNPQTLKSILGHASLSMTMDLYSHVLPNTKQEEMNNLQFKGL